MKPYLIQLGIFACYSILCFLLNITKSPDGGYKMLAFMLEVLFIIIHIVVTVVLVANKHWTSHHIFAIMGIAAVLYLLTSLSNS